MHLIEDTVIEDNHATRGAGIGQAGIFTLTHSIVRNNVASDRGGGLSIGNGSTTISDTAVTSNTAPTGAGLFLTYEEQYGTITSTLQLSGTDLLNNHGGNCGTAGGTSQSLGDNQSSDGTCVALLTDTSDTNGEGNGGGSSATVTSPVFSL